MFSDKPGVRERHLRRKYRNPLFPGAEVSEMDIAQARKQDAEEVDQFINHFRDLVKQAIELDTNADADVILKLKELLDKSYEQCAGLTGEQGEIKTMIKRLLASIMQAMWKGVGQDFQAQSKLENEEKARESHFALLEYPLVADLIRPDSPIVEDDLVPVLLSESIDNVRMAMQIFVPEQQIMLVQLARELLARIELDDENKSAAEQRLAEMEARVTVVSRASN
ncbi:MAG: hypothetical protein OQL09_03570 [Gammaproteobacteria bacterium]|nr:hypothetical protein [Gammaproteobacteria bacterium]